MLETSTSHYLYSVVNEEQRNLLQHLVLQPVIKQLMVEILDNYGLGKRLETALKNGSEVKILEAGSGSGSLLRDLADLLDTRGLLAAASLNGVDLNGDYIISAERQNRQKAAWANISYYQHNITEPLELNYSLKLEKKLEFDFICATVLMQYLPNAQRHVLNLYNYLKPGGVLYLCDSYMSFDGPSPCIPPVPALRKFGLISTKMVRDLNQDQIVAEQTAGWLREAGAEQVQVIYDLVQASGGDARSVEVLRYSISIVRTVSLVLLQAGLINQADYDEFLTSVYQVDRMSFTQLPFFHTVARKPL